MDIVIEKLSFLKFYIPDQQGEVGDQGDIGKIGETVSLLYALIFVFSPAVFLGNYVNHDLLTIIMLASIGKAYPQQI